MASHLLLDRTDPGVNELVTGWVDGGVYNVRLRIKQSSTDAKTARYEVEEVTDESGDTEEAASTEPEAPAKAPPKKTVTVYPK